MTLSAYNLQEAIRSKGGHKRDRPHFCVRESYALVNLQQTGSIVQCPATQHCSLPKMASKLR